MNATNPRWEEFREKLSGPGYCNFRKEREDDPDSFKWNCTQGIERPHARRLLREMGASPEDIAASLKYYEQHGGYCDCEIVFNVDADRRPRLTRRRTVKNPVRRTARKNPPRRPAA